MQYRKLSAPAIVGDSVVVGDLEGYLHFLDTSDGRLVARLKAGSGPILGAPLVSGDTVYALMASGELVAVKVGG